MSSEISIEARPSTSLGASRSTVDPAVRHDAKQDEGFRPWHFFVLSSILLATVGVMVARQASPEALVLISITIAAAGFAAAAFHRTIAPLTAPFVLRAGEPVTERTRAALEREKMLVLRTIKELEFDRAMGKLSQKDFDEMAGRLRTRAMSLIRQLDLESGAYTAVIEKELESRVKSRASRSSRVAHAGAVRGGAVLTTKPCACGTSNDVDAAFCKKCGARLSA